MTRSINDMSKALILLFLFFTGSLMGWVIELFFRRFCTPNGKKNRKWVNPGFLIGPYLPLYGSGLCILYILAHIKLPMHGNHPIAEKIILFIIMAIAMTLIEYVTGLIFIKGMNVKLWDYTDRWGNIQGIICPMFSFFWAVLGAVYYIFIHPHVLSALDWLSRNLAFSFFIGFFYGVFLIDLVYSFNLMVKLRRFAAEHDIVFKLEALRHHLIQEREERKEKYRFFLTMHSNRPLREVLEESLEKFSTKKIHKNK
jgi:uncharacterized membrane protein